MKKFSIIIPIFNLENFLEECVESVVKQNFSDYEIILVNDGSTDRSSEICNYYSAQYHFIKVIEKENGGASDARNTGINNARGEYLIFIDGDDYINLKTLEKINDSIQKYGDADVIFLEGVKVYPDGRKILINDGYEFEKIYDQEKRSVVDHISKLNKFPASPCTKVIRKEFLMENKIYFMKNLQIEDIDWSLNLYTKAEKYLYCSHVHYYYRQNRSGSETAMFTEKRFLDFLYIFEKWIEYAYRNNVDPAYKKLILSLLAYEYIFLIWGYHFLSRNNKKKYKSELKKLQWILNFRTDKRTKLIKYICNVAGIGLTAKSSMIYFRLINFRLPI